MDRRAMIGHIAAKFNVKLDENDPAFLLVEMNQFALESFIQELEVRLRETSEKLMAQTGAVVAASDDLQKAADVMVESKLRELHEVITQVAETAVEKAIREALARHVTGEATKLKGEISTIAGELRGALADARGSQTKVVGISALVGAGAALLLSWALSSSEPTATADNAAPVTQTASNVKQLPRNR